MNAANAAISARLKGDPVLVQLGLTATAAGVSRIYKNQAPQGTTANPVVAPYGIYQKMSGTDVYGHGGRLYRPLVYLVKFIDVGDSSARAGALDSRADELLTDEPLHVEGMQTLYPLRISDIDYTETSEGIVYQHVGGLYRLTVVPAY